METTMERVKRSTPVTVSVSHLDVDNLSHVSSTVDFLLEKGFDILMDTSQLSSIDARGKAAIEKLRRKVELGNEKNISQHLVTANCCV